MYSIAILKSLIASKLSVVFIFLLASSIAANVYAQSCELSNRAIESMGQVSIEFFNADNILITKSNVKLADNGKTRSAGFQKVCESVIKEQAMLFVFKNERKPAFHMNNVVAGLDIAFINKSGEIVSLQTMQPYVLGSIKKPTYSPDEPVVAALEAYVGFYEDNGISLGSILRWGDLDEWWKNKQ